MPQFSKGEKTGVQGALILKKVGIPTLDLSDDLLSFLTLEAAPVLLPEIVLNDTNVSKYAENS